MSKRHVEQLAVCGAMLIWLLMVLPHNLRFVIRQAELTNASENKICPCFPIISILIHHGSERSLNPLKQDTVQWVNAEIKSCLAGRLKVSIY